MGRTRSRVDKTSDCIAATYVIAIGLNVVSIEVVKNRAQERGQTLPPKLLGHIVAILKIWRCNIPTQ